MAELSSKESMGRFDFDGAEGIAFWVGDSDSEPSVKVMFDELDTLKEFLQENLPGLFCYGWEWGVTTKWGIVLKYNLKAAQVYAEALRADIASGKDSGSLEYHGLIMRRPKMIPAGSWVDVE